MSVEYKIVELSQVNDADLEATLNQWTAEGWTLDHIDYIVRESQRRPGMAFVFFTRPRGDEPG